MKQIFLHIVKTAGTSFRWTIKENYTLNELYERDQHEFNWNTLTIEQQREVKMIYGHLFFGIHNQINESCKYVTFLRDPVERVISYYYYVIAKTDNPNYKETYGLSLEEFVLRGNQDVASNQQTKILCGSNDVVDFDLARRNIEQHFSFVGIVEEYKKSVKLLGEQLEWQNIIFHELNRTADKPAVPQHVRQVIEEANRVDRKLYEWAYNSFLNKTCNG